MVLIARREHPALAELDGIAAMRVGPLAWSDARTLLMETAPGRIDAAVLERILAETRGVPRAVVEELAGHSAAALAGGFAVPAPRPIHRETDRGWVERAGQLPTDARRLLLVAATDPTGDPPLVWRAAAQLGIGAGAAECLQSAGLIGFGPLVLFTCPALRSAVYAMATHDERRSVHLALAHASCADTDSDRRAWHLSRATSGLDGKAADRMEQCASAAGGRGGVAARAAFLKKAALLTADPVLRADRALAAAESLHEARAPEDALRLLSIAETAPTDKTRLDVAQLLRARITFTTRRDSAAAKQILDAAHRVAPHRLALAREGYLEALVAAMFSGGLNTGLSPVEVARVARSSAPPASSRPVDLLLDALVTRFLDGYVDAIGPLRKALAAFEKAESDLQTARWLWLAGLVAADLWDSRAWQTLTHRHEEPDVDDRAMRPAHIPAYRALAEIYHGQLDSERVCLEQAGRLASTSGAVAFPIPLLLLDAWRGHHADPSDLQYKRHEQAWHIGAGSVLSATNLAAAVVHNGAGRYSHAFTAARDAAEPDQLCLTGWALVELIEAAARSDQPDTARCAIELLSKRTRAAGTDWALGTEMAARALVADGPDAEAWYLQAIDRLTRSQITIHLARVQLLYGEWLRRQNRRIDARIPLRAARHLFSAIGANTFADRTHKEQLATGETARKRTVDMGRQLTPQEDRIAYLARDGLTNPEIAARLFVSARTVEYHLHKVFGKVGVTSRTELHLVLAAAPGAERRHPLDRARTHAVSRANSIAS